MPRVPDKLNSIDHCARLSANVPWLLTNTLNLGLYSTYQGAFAALSKLRPNIDHLTAGSNLIYMYHCLTLNINWSTTLTYTRSIAKFKMTLVPIIRVKGQMVQAGKYRQTDKWTDGHYQTYHLSATWSIKIIHTWLIRVMLSLTYKISYGHLFSRIKSRLPCQEEGLPKSNISCLVHRSYIEISKQREIWFSVWLHVRIWWLL